MKHKLDDRNRKELYTILTRKGLNSIFQFFTHDYTSKKFAWPKYMAIIMNNTRVKNYIP